MLNLDPSKLLIIAVVAVILLGPDRLPQLARQIGGAWRSFNEYRQRMESEVRNSIPDLPSSTEIARLTHSPAALLNHLSKMSVDAPDAPNAPDASETASPTIDRIPGDDKRPESDGSRPGSKDFLLPEPSPSSDPRLN